MPADVGKRPIKNVGNGRFFVKPPKDYPGKRYIGKRYSYNYQVDAWKKTGRLPKKGEITHHDGNKKVTSAGYQTRSKHYGSGHGRPYSKGGKSLTTLFKNRSPQRPRGTIKHRGM